MRRRPWWVERGVYGTLRDGWVTLWRVGYTGVPFGVVQFPSDGLKGWPLFLLVEREAEKMLTKDAARRVVGAAGGVVADDEFSTLYPTLYAHLTQTAWPDGTVRETSSLSLFTDGPAAKCVLKDRSLGVCLWATCPTFTGLLGVLEALLCDPGAEWRVDRQNPGQKASRVKK